MDTGNIVKDALDTISNPPDTQMINQQDVFNQPQSSTQVTDRQQSQPPPIDNQPWAAILSRLDSIDSKLTILDSIEKDMTDIKHT